MARQTTVKITESLVNLAETWIFDDKWTQLTARCAKLEQVSKTKLTRMML